MNNNFWKRKDVPPFKMPSWDEIMKAIDRDMNAADDRRMAHAQPFTRRYAATFSDEDAAFLRSLRIDPR